MPRARPRWIGVLALGLAFLASSSRGEGIAEYLTRILARTRSRLGGVTKPSASWLGGTNEEDPGGEAQPGSTEAPPPEALPRWVDLVGIEFVRIPAGSFSMGSPEDEEGRLANEGPRHRVVISRSFWIGRSEVTQAQWQSVMGGNPSRFRGPDRPVEQVSWEDCQEFCRRLSAREGAVCRLPTEAEWEYACRAGTQTARYQDLQVAASFGDSTQQLGPDPVGKHAANRFGLVDTLGNVNEWTADWYGEYPAEEQADPVGPLQARHRVARGGSYDCPPRYCRAALRFDYPAGLRRPYLGFRVVREGKGQEPRARCVNGSLSWTPGEGSPVPGGGDAPPGSGAAAGTS